MHPEAISSEQKKIFDRLKNFPDYYLAGGTALALQIGHRISIDFDFFSKEEIPFQLLPKIKKIFKDYKIKTIVSHSEQLTVSIDGVNLTFVKYPFPLIFKLKRYKGLKLLSVPEIAAAKAYSLGRRATLKDYVDLYWIIKNKYLTLKKLIGITQRKYKQVFDPRLFLEQLIYLKDVADIEMQFLEKKVTKKEIQNFFEKEVRKLKL